MYHTCAWFLCTPEERVRSPGAGDADGYELTCGFQEENMGPTQEQPLLLTSRLLLQPQDYRLSIIITISILTQDLLCSSPELCV